MRIHVILDEEGELVAFVPVAGTEPSLGISPVNNAHTLHEHIEVSDELADLKGIDAVNHVREHMRRHLGTEPTAQE